VRIVKVFILTPVLLIGGVHTVMIGQQLKGVCLMLFGVTFGFEAVRTLGIYDLNAKAHLALLGLSLLALIALGVAQVGLGIGR
jgi:hypothetical protein